MCAKIGYTYLSGFDIGRGGVSGRKEGMGIHYIRYSVSKQSV